MENKNYKCSKTNSSGIKLDGPRNTEVKKYWLLHFHYIKHFGIWHHAVSTWMDGKTCGLGDLTLLKKWTIGRYNAMDFIYDKEYKKYIQTVGRSSVWNIYLKRGGERQIWILGKQNIDNLSSRILSRPSGHFSPILHVKVFCFWHKTYLSCV